MGHVVGEDRIRARDGRMKSTMVLKCGVVGSMMDRVFRFGLGLSILRCWEDLSVVHF